MGSMHRWPAVLATLALTAAACGGTAPATSPTAGATDGASPGTGTDAAGPAEDGPPFTAELNDGSTFSTGARIPSSSR